MTLCKYILAAFLFFPLSANAGSVCNAIFSRHEWSQEGFNLLVDAVRSNRTQNRVGFDYLFKNQKRRFQGYITGFQMRPGGDPQSEITFLSTDGKEILKLRAEQIKLSTVQLQIAPIKRPEAPPGLSREDLARADKIVYLTHQTWLKYLPSILADKALKIGPNYGNGIVNGYQPEKGNYLEAVGKAWVGSRINKTTETELKISLIFSLDLLNRNDYYANRGWAAGYIVRDSVRPTDYAGLHVLLWDVGVRLQINNEFIFKNDVGFGALRAIVVAPGQKDLVEKMLLEAGFPLDKSRDFIIESLTYPEIEG